MSSLPLLPLTARRLLRRYRLEAREALAPNLAGGQLMRRKGQGLEFREYVTYQPGDDIRFVDWRASVRRGLKHDLVVRSFAAEEELKLLISVDTRPTMALPEPERDRSVGCSKLLIARWLAEALARVALDGGDRAAIHRLFAASSSQPDLIASEAQLRQVIMRLTPSVEEQPPTNLRQLQPFLPPTAVWVIITDGYFMPSDQAPLARDLRDLLATITRAQVGMCWVLLIDLDSWPYEIARLGGEVWQVPRPHAPGDLTVQLGGDQPGLENRRAVEARIEAARNQFMQETRLDALDYRHWPWPAADEPDPTRFFTDHFLNDRRLQSIFVKQTI